MSVASCSGVMPARNFSTASGGFAPRKLSIILASKIACLPDSNNGFPIVATPRTTGANVPDIAPVAAPSPALPIAELLGSISCPAAVFINAPAPTLAI